MWRARISRLGWRLGVARRSGNRLCTRGGAESSAGRCWQLDVGARTRNAACRSRCDSAGIRTLGADHATRERSVRSVWDSEPRSLVCGFVGVMSIPNNAITPLYLVSFVLFAFQYFRINYERRLMN